MTQNRVINALSYLSILFLPVLFPLIVWLLTGSNPEAHHAAGKAFWLHLLPTLLGIGLLVILGVSGIYMDSLVNTGWLAVLLLAVFGIIAIASYLWAIVRGIQYLIAD
ncbi:membrane protein [Lactiplantibacillus herbarum]|uniref:membrane protein n=1 Tax=Lactiplantibacillus herbarum TaxID=1670446 RepID=UPI00064F65CE|nr:membrane protein [Lactiplantibacillus herbarum]